MSKHLVVIDSLFNVPVRNGEGAIEVFETWHLADSVAQARQRTSLLLHTIETIEFVED